MVVDQADGAGAEEVHGKEPNEGGANGAGGGTEACDRTGWRPMSHPNCVRKRSRMGLTAETNASTRGWLGCAGLAVGVPQVEVNGEDHVDADHPGEAA
jgi:hypothetical protein